MRVLVATAATNGKVVGDFTSCVDGELVSIDEPCGGHDPAGGQAEDDPCGCERSFTGLNSHCSTTTAQVVERDLNEADVREAIRSSFLDGGRIDPDRTPRDLAEATVEAAWQRIWAVAEHFPVGTVVGRRLERIIPRQGR